MNRGLAVALGLLVLGAARSAPAGDPTAQHPASRYGPVPPGIAALVGTPTDETLAKAHVEAAASANPEEATPARAVLMMCGDVGVRVAAERLASGPVSDAGLLNLLIVLSASERPEVDVILSEAAQEPRFEARVFAASGLGAGRSSLAVPTLVTLARDAMPAVRAAAIRAVFSIEGGAARSARVALKDDRDPRVAALRLRLHRLRGDAGRDLLPVALRAYLAGTTAEVRLEGARCLSLPAVEAPEWMLALVILENGTSPAYARLVRDVIHAPRVQRDPGKARAAAAEALVTLLSRPSLAPETRASLLDIGVEWLAHPVKVEGTRVDEEAQRTLVTALPDAGAALVAPIVRRLQSDTSPFEIDIYGRAEPSLVLAGSGPSLVTGDGIAASPGLEGWRLTRRLPRRPPFAPPRPRRKAPTAFDDPTPLVALLASLDETVSLPALRSIVDPPHEPSSAVLSAVSGALADLGHVADETVARMLLAPRRPRDIRTDGVLALSTETAPYALPLLIAAWTDPDDAVSSKAGEVLLERPEPEARVALELGVLDDHWRRHEERVLRSLAWRADDQAYALLERALASPSGDLRTAAFDAFWDPRSPLRGPRAAALVAKAAEDEPPRGDLGVPVRALISVDAPRGIEFIRARLATSKTPGILLRNLEATDEPKALDLALEVAATNDPGMLTEVARVLSGPAARDISRTDPFWRRLLMSKDRHLVGAALDSLGAKGVRHGPLAELLIPILTDKKPQDEGNPLLALKALATDPASLRGAEALLWDIASDRSGDDEIFRNAAARALEGIASAATRAKALAWLREAHDDAATTIRRIGRIAGIGASAAEAEDLVRQFEAALASRYSGPPYFHVPDPDTSIEASYVNRIAALSSAIVLSNDAPALDRLAEHLLDPRFAAYSREARFAEDHAYPQSGGPLSPLSETPPLSARLYWGTNAAAHQPILPVPSEPEHIVAALRSTSDEAAAARIARVVAEARATGRLALFSDLYLGRLAADLHVKKYGDFGASAAVLEDAMAKTEPAGGAEELDATDRRLGLMERRGRFEEAAMGCARAARIAARQGFADRAPDSWVLRRARQDFLEGAAAAAAARLDEARDSFRRGESRAPNDPAVLNMAAWYRARVGIDLAVAESQARRALLLERRLDDEPTNDTLDTLAYVLLKEGKFPEALAETSLVMERIQNSTHWDGGGEFHWRHAQALVQSGRLKSAVQPLLDALKYEPTLAPDLLADPLLTPLRDRPTADLTQILKEAERLRLSGESSDSD